jgi:hypothetical protein
MIYESDKWGFYVMELPNINFFNPTHSIIRVKRQSNYYDLKAIVGVENPNPVDHLCLVVAPERTIDTKYLAQDRLDFPPGLKSLDYSLADVPLGFAFLIDKQQRIKTTNPQSGSAGMSVSGTNMFDPEKVLLAISPRLPNRDYTTLKDQNSDPNADSVGLFINRDGTVLLKSTGGAITLGKEGVHIGGRLFHESSSVDTGILSDNTISDLIPSTIPTAGAAYPKIPNFGQIANIANAGAKFVQVATAAKAVSQFATAVASV